MPPSKVVVAALKRLKELRDELAAVERRSAIHKKAQAADPSTPPLPEWWKKVPEQKMLQGLYRGYAGEAPGELVFHAGADFRRPNPGLFTHPDKHAVEQFQRFTDAPKLHKFEALPRRTGTDEDVYEVARRMGIYDPSVPASQYLEQGDNAIFENSADVVEELRSQGLDALRLKDGMGKEPSLVALDPSVLRPAAATFASPQRKVADFYAQKRAAQTGQRPHVEMVLVDPNTGRQYGHSTMGTGAQPPLSTRARELQPEDIRSRTQLYARGGLAQLKECSCHQKR